MAVLFNGEERFERFWERITQGTCEIVSKSVHWFNRRSQLSFFSICSKGSLTVSKNAMYENCIANFLLNMCICHMCTINRQMVAVTI